MTGALESVLLDLGQRIDKVERASQPVVKPEQPSDPFFSMLEDAIAQKAPPLLTRFNKEGGNKAFFLLKKCIFNTAIQSIPYLKCTHFNINIFVQYVSRYDTQPPIPTSWQHPRMLPKMLPRWFSRKLPPRDSFDTHHQLTSSF